jgi:hypothetical protein
MNHHEGTHEGHESHERQRFDAFGRLRNRPSPDPVILIQAGSPDARAHLPRGARCVDLPRRDRALLCGSCEYRGGQDVELLEVVPLLAIGEDRQYRVEVFHAGRENPRPLRGRGGPPSASQVLTQPAVSASS